MYVGPRSSKISRSFSGVTPRVMPCFRSTAVISLNRPLYSGASCLLILTRFLYILRTFLIQWYVFHLGSIRFFSFRFFLLLIKLAQPLF